MGVASTGLMGLTVLGLPSLFNDVPHSVQYFAWGEFLCLQLEQVLYRDVPHSAQNFAPSEFKMPQFGQFTIT
jgi:hypothetical protein